MIDLYYMPGSAAMAVHATLEEVGAEYRLIRVVKDAGRIEPPELERLNPHKRVPTMVDGDLVMYESAACVMHLSDVYPDAALAPEPRTSERALWYRWLTYLTNTVQATFVIRFYPGRFVSAEDGEPGVSRQAGAALDGMRAFLEGELARGGPYLLGERFTSADFYLMMLTRWGRRLEPRWWDEEAIGAHFRRVLERPSVQKMWAQEGLPPYPAV